LALFSSLSSEFWDDYTIDFARLGKERELHSQPKPSQAEPEIAFSGKERPPRNDTMRDVEKALSE